MEKDERQVWEEPVLEVVQFEQENIIATSCESDGSCVSDGCASNECQHTCFAAGTKVTMADGTLKNIEDIREGELIRTFDHEAGKFTEQEVFIAFKGNEADHSFTLHFEDGTELSIVGEHDLFERESMKYVTISRKDAETFAGKHFYSVARKAFVKLLTVTLSMEKTEFYSLYTKYNFNSIVNGMLSVPDDIDENLNIYEFGEDLKADAKALAADLAKHGVFEYSESDPYTREDYETMNLRYLNIIIGKGLATREDLIARHEKYQAQRAESDGMTSAVNF